MNQRPTRAPAPPPETAKAAVIDGDPRDIADASFSQVERPNNVPATRAQPSAQEPPVNEIVPQAEPQPALPETGNRNLLSAIAAVMSEITPVEKGGWNKFQSYAFARMQDLLVTITPLMGKHGIVVFQHEEGREMFDNGRAIAVRYRFTIVHKSGEVWFERPLQTGLSNCRNTKDGFDDKALNKCHTAARKYFLMSLFQIPTEDMEDGDGQTNGNNGQTQQRPQGQRRPVPSPSGKLSPHILPVVDGESPAAWATRFKTFIDKAESTDEVNKWYIVNAGVFEKLKAGNHMLVYNDLLDFMDACEKKFTGGKTDPISSGNGGFPGDTTPKATAAESNGEIPIGIDRKLTDQERDWLINLRDAYGQCTTVEEIASEQDSSMMPSQGSVSPYAWKRAEDLTDQHIERAQGAN